MEILEEDIPQNMRAEAEDKRQELIGALTNLFSYMSVKLFESYVMVR